MMRFLAVVLTLQHHKPQDLLTFVEWPQLRQDISMALFPTECQLLTVACLRSEPQQTVLRLTLAEEQQEDHGIFSQLLSRIHAGQLIRFCQRDGKVVSLDVSDPMWTGISTWADFQKTPHHSSFGFAFTTPFITASPLAAVFPDALPFPEPETIFLPALECWQKLAGPLFPWSGAHLIQAACCVLANYRFYTVEIPLTSHPTFGYLGWVEYSCLQPQAEEVAALAALARMTFFTGCGYDTTLGSSFN